MMKWLMLNMYIKNKIAQSVKSLREIRTNQVKWVVKGKNSVQFWQTVGHVRREITENDYLWNNVLWMIVMLIKL